MFHTVRIALLALMLIAARPCAYANDWPQWRGPQRNGLTTETGLLQSWPEGGPQRRWLYTNCGVGYSGPVIADDTLYILGARDGQCYFIAINAETGEELWATPFCPEFENDWGNGPRGTPAVDGDRVYGLSGNGTLVCVQRSDGRVLWSATMQSLGGEVPFWGYTESVLIDGDKVLCTPGGDQGAVVALDKVSGKLLWQSSELSDAAHYSSLVRSDIQGQPQYVKIFEKRLVGLSVADGSLLWEAPFPGRVAVIPTPIVQGNRIFATAGYGAGCMLVDIDPQNKATVVYSNRRMKNHHGGVIQLGDFVYGYSDDTGWACLEAATGNLKWRERSALEKGAIAYADGKFYCIGEDEGDVVLIDASPAGWQERARFTLEPQTTIRKPRGKIWTHPVIVNGNLYLRDQDLLYCYSVKQVNAEAASAGANNP